MEKVLRLIKMYKPENYNLFINLNRKEKSFTGLVKIKGEAFENEIMLHQKDLTITKVSNNNQELKFRTNDENQLLIIELNKVGKEEIEVEFRGNITDNMTGIYPSYYSINGVKKEVIATQFQSHFAREAFPHVDEPEAKATFDLSITFDKENDDEKVLSNMPEILVEDRKTSNIWKFETTKRMSSYLLAFAVGDFVSIDTKTENGTKVEVFSTKAHEESELYFALEVAKKTIEFYENYFNVKYPLPHSYHLALPDFSAGAMENWGLITYREIYLLVAKNATVSEKQQTALVIAHEVAHQWFGNLVTMKWWDDLWLNESFANMMEYVAIDNIYPNWNIFEDFQAHGISSALEKDATDGVQSVHMDVNHPDEINTLFDAAIVYAKGSRLMHMLRKWLGDNAFSKGLSNYFKKHQYSNIQGNDLWIELSNTSSKKVEEFMTSWIDQPGYPCLTAKVVDNNLVLSQEQFFIGEHEDKNRLWHIPLNTNWNQFLDVFNTKDIVVKDYQKLLSENNNLPLLFNFGNTAHYIVKYEGELLENLLNNIEKLDKITIQQLIKDNLLLAEAGKISYSLLIKVLLKLTGEKSYLVNNATSEIINSLSLFIEKDSKEEERFKKLVKLVNNKNFLKLGVLPKENDSDEDELNRMLTISSMLYADDSQTINELKSVFEKYKDNISEIPAGIRSFVLVNQLKQQDTNDLADLLLKEYKETNNSGYKRHLLRALSSTKNQETVEKILLSFKDKNIIKPQDLVGWYYSLLRNKFIKKTVWDWVCQNWDFITKILGGDMSFDSFVLAPGSVFKTEEELEEYIKFFEPMKNNFALSRSISLTINQIDARIKLINKEKEAVVNEIEKIEI